MSYLCISVCMFIIGGMLVLNNHIQSKNLLDLAVNDKGNEVGSELHRPVV